MKKIKVKDNIKKYLNGLNPREKKLLLVVVVIAVFMGLNTVLPKIKDVYDIFKDQTERLEKANRAIDQSQRIVHKYMTLKAKQGQIEKKFEKNEVKEGHLSYVDSLKSQDMFDFSIGAQQEKEFGKEFNQVTFKINFKVTSLTTIMNFIRKLENEKRKYLISELSIKKAYGNFTVVIEVNSIEKRK